MASATLKMAFGIFMTWILITELSAQSEICTLKEENAQVSLPLYVIHFNIVGIRYNAKCS